jgi:hypothetical protein
MNNDEKSARDARVWKLSLQGYGCTVIADRYGLTPHQVRCIILRRVQELEKVGTGLTPAQTAMLRRERVSQEMARTDEHLTRSQRGAGRAATSAQLLAHKGRLLALREGDQQHAARHEGDEDAARVYEALIAETNTPDVPPAPAPTSIPDDFRPKDRKRLEN